MAIYYCNHCGNLKDEDYNVCSEDPREANELVCEDCIVEIEEELAEDARQYELEQRRTHASLVRDGEMKA